MTFGYVLVGAALAVGALDWHAVSRRNRESEYLLKPLTMIVLIAAAIALFDGTPAYVCGFALAALILSLAGDVFLMLPRDLFVAGLGSFLFGHVAYIAAFNPTAPPLIPTVVAVVVVGGTAGAMYVRLLRGMRARNQTKLAAPVAVYVLAISAMVVSALATVGRSEWTPGRSAFAVAGALLFFASDGMIGWSRFVGDFPRSRLAIMVTYHLAQACLVLGLLGS